MDLNLKPCGVCGKVYNADVLIDGWVCEACLRKELNLERFYKFATSETYTPDTADRLEEFFFTKVLNIAPPKTGSPELRAYLRMEYKRSSAADRLLDEHLFTRKIHDYVFGNYAVTEAYAHWLRNYSSDIFDKLGVRK